MKRLLRVVARVFATFVAVTTLFGMGSAALAAVTKPRIQTTKDPASNEPTAASVFGGERFESSARAFRGGRVVTWFAGHDVDLRGATMDPSGAMLDVRTMYGATQIAIPAGWRVESHVRSIFGGTQVDTNEGDLPADAPLLTLRGFSLFGGVRVTSSPDASWSGQDHDGEALPPAIGEATSPAASEATSPSVGPATASIDHPEVTADEATVDALATASTESEVDAGTPMADSPLPG